jgi:hypothetical protein
MVLAHEAALLRPDDCHIFLDYSSAYDRVPHQILLENLSKKGASKKIYNLIYSLMCRDLTSTVVINQSELPNRLVRRRGLFQGSILAPMLFNVFINPLAEALHSLEGSRPIPLDLFYADDLKLSGSDPIVLQSKLNICLDWSDANGMQFGLSKCHVVWSKKSNLKLDL